MLHCVSVRDEARGYFLLSLGELIFRPQRAVRQSTGISEQVNVVRLSGTHVLPVPGSLKKGVCTHFQYSLSPRPHQTNPPL